MTTLINWTFVFEKKEKKKIILLVTVSCNKYVKNKDAQSEQTILFYKENRGLKARLEGEALAI